MITIPPGVFPSQLRSLGMGSVHEPPTGGSFSHVQFRPSVAGRSAILSNLVIWVDQTATVRIGFQSGFLASADGVAEGVNAGASGGNIIVAARSETNAAQIALVSVFGNVRVPGDTWCPLPGMWKFSDLAAFTCNPIVTGVGIAITGMFWDSVILA